MLSWCIIGIAVAWLLVILIQKYIPTAKSSTKVVEATSVDKNYADMISGISACSSITTIAKRRRNTALAMQVAALRVSLAQMSDDSEVSDVSEVSTTSATA